MLHKVAQDVADVPPFMWALGDKAIDHSDTFALIAELSIALAGFSSVVVAFSGKERKYTAVEVGRIQFLFKTAGLLILGTLSLLAMFSAGIPAAIAFGVVSSVTVIWILVDGIFSIPRIYRHARSADTSLNLGLLAITTSIYGLSVLLLICNTLWIGGAWPLIVVYMISLLVGLWAFMRLLMLRN